jgi:uncharacterized protein
MRIEHHVLTGLSAGSTRSLQSWHFGRAKSGKKVYLQASLHADEIPGMLVLHYLKAQLSALAQADKIAGEIVLVPVANPIGLAQEIHGSVFGRFDLSTGINFNRGYQDLSPQLKAKLAGQLGANGVENMHQIRAKSLEILQQIQPTSEAQQLKLILQRLAIDADVVLDLHCDNQAVMHLYTGTPLVAATLPLAAYLQAQALLICKQSGDDPFDESCSRHWWELAQHFGPEVSVPMACLSITVELRGEVDVCHQLAEQDAAALIAFLQHSGHIEGLAPPLPAAQCLATELEAVEPIKAPASGVVVFSRALGTHINAGEAIGDLVDPIAGTTTPLLASVSGILFARISRRYVHAGTSVAKIAGTVPFRSGNLLSA